MAYKLLTFMGEDGPRAGILRDKNVFDAQTISAKPDYATVLGILADWKNADTLFTDIIASGKLPAPTKRLIDANILAPIQYPGEIWAAGANYQDHINEMAEGEYQAINAKSIGGRPWFFSKSSRGAVIGQNEVRPLPAFSKMVDWEIELAVVMGRVTNRVSAAEALDYVAGYTIANDLSARDNVVRDGVAGDSPFRFDWLSHKGFDGACPMGPWIVPAKEVADPQALGLKLWIDGEIMQDSNTKHMIFTVAEQIEEISARVTMYPGDVILTGTPSGVGMGRNRFLRSGQKLHLWIEGIGELHHGFS